ncbi:DUF4440 domain-containing protein [Altererythrobacter xixiisoli]|uniref:DUF4440 domain-containing protein n=1 Tax=Croceibacterium xixiisoli TaxID=1476466 RepID=A0A6I4U1G9_9SPHN|nr:DUF4440 domain-containing protein [Croceibacterium xixiisoli]MXP00514.1 DUF4440 domain-containing protein [Croceibacterium xixiisoli]
MEDERIWKLERSLWTGDTEHYRELIDADSLFVVPAPPFVMRGNAAADAMAQTPRWASVDFSQQQVVRPQEGLIVIAYHARASADGKDDYAAHCTTTLRRLSHDDWRVVQHQQTPPLSAISGSEG